MCKLHQGSKKDVLMDVLPVDICCKLSEYFGCLRCECMMKQEQHYTVYHKPYDNKLTKPEKQLIFKKLYQENMLYNVPTYYDSGNVWKTEIDRIFENMYLMK